MGENERPRLERWVVVVSYGGERDDPLWFSNRPAITAGAGYIRVASMDREDWIPEEIGGQKAAVSVRTEAEVGILACMQDIPAEELRKRAERLKGGGDLFDWTMGEIVQRALELREMVEQQTLVPLDAEEPNAVERGE